MPFFSEDTFKEFVRQFKKQTNLEQDGWEFYVKNSDFTVYRRPASSRNPSLYEYRSFGGWKDVKPDTLAKVYLDLEFRKKWDKNMKSFQEFPLEDGNKGNHFEMNYPWPLSNRDYAYTIEKKTVKEKETGNEYQVILGESLPKSTWPENKGVIRIDTYMQNICIAPGEDGNGCTVFMDYFDDPKGSIPKSVINWAAKTAVPTFINNLKAACQQYEKEHSSSTSSVSSDDSSSETIVL